MKVFVTSDGFVASHIKKYFKSNLVENIENADVIINTIGILKEEKYTYEDSHIMSIKKLIPNIKNKKLIHISALGSTKNHPSKYKHTKAMAEEIIKKELVNYVILKPSIILGDGQKLYDDLKYFKNFPIIFAPKMKIQPLNIQKLIVFIDEIIKKDMTGEFELCGEKVITMKELFIKVFDKYNKNPLILEMPKVFFRVMLPLLSLLKIMSKDEYLMIEDNICKGDK